MKDRLTKAQRDRLSAIDKFGKFVASDRAALPGIHFCPDWDFLPVCDDSPEKSCCTCRPVGLASLSQEGGE